MNEDTVPVCSGSLTLVIADQNGDAQQLRLEISGQGLLTADLQYKLSNLLVEALKEKLREKRTEQQANFEALGVPEKEETA